MQSIALFHQPPFVCCQDWDAVCVPGFHVLHGALFYATMLINDGGERREEICGALADDVVAGPEPISNIMIVDNEFRRLKNTSSERVVIIHPELIRLGFLKYVAVIKALGYKLLFPDLYSPTTKSPLGDRYHDQLDTSKNLAA